MNLRPSAWSDPVMEDNGIRNLVFAVIVVALVAGAWIFRDLWMPAEPTQPSPPPAAEPVEA
ncbi:MAG: hypothetical protein JJ992_15370, partial [Planctomycetes bacterium]|nr:hypothetical protein [Planctomycetota bacterium]